MISSMLLQANRDSMNYKMSVADVAKMQTQGVSNFLFHKNRTDFSSSFFRAEPKSKRWRLFSQQTKSTKLEKNKN